MTHFRTVPHHSGQRFTFGVKRYHAINRPGWRTVRALGQFWRLPPGVNQYLTDEDIKRLATTCDARQRASFEHVCQAGEMRKTCDATVRGIYWTGQKAFQVGVDNSPVSVQPVRFTVGEVIYTGIRVTVQDADNTDYLLVTDKDVSLATFYKYLMFYSRYVSMRSLKTEGYCGLHNILPYGRDTRLEKCSIESLNVTPQH